MHSYTFPYKEGSVVRDLEGFFLGGGRGGGDLRGFRFLNPGFRNLRMFRDPPKAVSEVLDFRLANWGASCYKGFDWPFGLE